MSSKTRFEKEVKGNSEMAHCIRNRDDHSLLDFTPAVQCIKYLISFRKIIKVDFAFCQILQKVQLMEIPRTLKLGQLVRSYLS